MEIVISPSTKKTKKYQAVIDGRKTVHFGAAGMSDFTKHKDEERKKRYIARMSNQDWSKSGVDTAGFYSRWINWNMPTIEESVKDLNKKYKDISFKLRK